MRETETAESRKSIALGNANVMNCTPLSQALKGRNPLSIIDYAPLGRLCKREKKNDKEKCYLLDDVFLKLTFAQPTLQVIIHNS
jgi:hypothetical protein